MFGFLKNKNRRKEEKEMPEIKKDIEEAKENIENKGPDSQSETDRVDESVAEKIKDDGDEDSQDAKDRVDESEGEEKTKEEKPEDEGKASEVPSESKDVSGDGLRAMIREVMTEVIGEEIKKALTEMSTPDKSEKNPTPVAKESALSYDAAARKYSN